MQTTTEQIKTSDGLTLHTIYWLPEDEIRAVVLLVHGIAEHIGRYTHVAKWLTGHGYAVCGLDHRGHGRSEGERVYFESLTQLVDDLTVYVDHIQASYPNQPIFMYGHSMGALISLLYVIEHQQKLAGWVSSATPLMIDTTQPKFVVTMGTFLSKLFPKTHLLPLDINGLSHDPAVIEDYKNDPLVYTRPTRLGVGAEIIAKAQYARTQLKKLQLPVLIIHGTKDTVTPSSGSEYLFEKISSKDKTLKLYPNLFHELHNEPEKQQILADVLHWLDSH